MKQREREQSKMIYMSVAQNLFLGKKKTDYDGNFCSYQVFQIVATKKKLNLISLKHLYFYELDILLSRAKRIPQC